MRLAIELSGDYIDVVEYKGENSLAISKSVRGEMPEGAFENGIVTNTTLVADRLKEILREQHIITKKAVLCVSGMDVMVKEVKIPRCPARHEREMLKNELVRNDALRNGYLFDYLPGEEAEGGLFHYSVYLLPTELVRNYEQTMRRAGLTLERIEPVSWSMEKLSRLLKLKERENLTVLVDAGSQTLDVLMTGPDMKDVYRNIQVKEEGIEENVFIVSAISSVSMETDSTEKILDRLVETVSKLIQFQYQNSRGSVVDQILVYGSMAADPEFVEKVAQRTGIAAKPCPVPTQSVHMQEDKNVYTELSLGALGAAGSRAAGVKRDLSFVPFLNEAETMKTRDYIPLVAGLALLLGMSVWYAATVFANNRLERENTEFQVEITRIENSDEYQRKLSVQEALGRLASYNENCVVCIQTLEETSRFTSDIFTKVDALVPQGIRIYGHEADGNTMRFLCMAEDQDGPADFAHIVTDAGIFRNVSYTGFTSYQKEEGSTGYSFSLECSR